MSEPSSRFQLPPGSWFTVLACLVDCFPGIDAATWHDRFRRERVLDDNGIPIAMDAPYRVGLQVRYFREVADEPAVPFDIDIVHRDDDLVVVDKPHFLATMPAGRFVEQTVSRRLARVLGQDGLVPLHRLDRLTAGLVMFSARAANRDAYLALFRQRRVHKHYEAVAAPLPEQAFPATCHARLVPGEPFFRMRDVPGEANSETRIDVLDRGSAYWHYALAPLTGRKHQLRVQMATLGAPVLHDPWYPELRADADDFARPMQLLARELAFVDPISGLQRRFVSERTLSWAAKLDGLPSRNPWP
jgi:tRNA pseudouridine32 synthase/23S rRNA pseudouridine746 synthase